MIFIVLLLGVNWYLSAHSVTEQTIRAEQDMNAFIEEYQKDPEAMETYMADYYTLLRAYSPFDPDSKRPESIYSENDTALFADFSALRDLTKTHTKTVKKAMQIAQSRIGEYAYLGYRETSFELVYQKSVLDSYAGLDELVFPMENVVGYDLFFGYDGFCALLLTALALCGIMLVTPETNGGMLLLLRSTKRGRSQTFFAKMIVGFFVTALLCVLFTGVTLLALFLKIGLHGINLPIQMVDSMALSPFSISIGEGIVLALGWRIFASLTFLSLIVLAACLFRRYLAVFTTALVVIGANYAAATYSFLNDYSVLKNINFFWSLNGIRTLEAWRGVKLFGKCMSLSPALVVIYLVLIAACLAAGCVCFCRGSFRERTKKRLHLKLPFSIPVKRFRRKYRTALYPYELKKMISVFSLVVMLSCLLLLVYASDSAFHLQRDYQQNLYTSYMEELEGDWTEEKHLYLQDLYVEITDILNQKEAMKLQYQAGLISSSEYNRYLWREIDAENRKQVVTELWQHSQYLKDHHEAGYEVSYFDETGWRQLLSVNLSWIICAAIILLCSDLFSCEYRSGFQKIQSVARRGRASTVFAKLCVALTVALVLSAVSELCQFLFVSHFSGLPGASYSAISMELLGKSGSCPMWLYFLLSTLKNTALYGLLALVCAGVSRFTKRLIPTLLIMTVFVFAPLVFSYFGITLLDHISFLKLFGR